MRLTLIPPDYTGLPVTVKEEGHIEALKGTVVNLEARATKGVKEGKDHPGSGEPAPPEGEGGSIDRKPPCPFSGDLSDQGEG